jgi:small subunit ribosomal protein S3
VTIERRFVEEGKKKMLIKEYIKKETERAGFGGVEIQRTPMGTILSVVTERPGIIIGRAGKNINTLTKNIAEKFEIENPQLEITEIGAKASLNAQIMAQKVAAALERGWHNGIRRPRLPNHHFRKNHGGSASNRKIYRGTH